MEELGEEVFRELPSTAHLDQGVIGWYVLNMGGSDFQDEYYTIMNPPSSKFFRTLREALNDILQSRGEHNDVAEITKYGRQINEGITNYSEEVGRNGGWLIHPISFSN